MEWNQYIVDSTITVLINIMFFSQTTSLCFRFIINVFHEHQNILVLIFKLLFDFLILGRNEEGEIRPFHFGELGKKAASAQEEGSYISKFNFARRATKSGPRCISGRWVVAISEYVVLSYIQ